MTPPDAEREARLRKWAAIFALPGSSLTLQDVGESVLALLSDLTALRERVEALEAERAEEAPTWAEIARDSHGFPRTQGEWDKLASYARERAARVEALTGALRELGIAESALTDDTLPDAGWRDAIERFEVANTAVHDIARALATPRTPTEGGTDG